MALKRHSRRPAGRPVGYPLVLLSAFLFAAGGNVVKALFKLGYSPLVLAQLRIWSAFVGLFLALVVPASCRHTRASSTGHFRRGWSRRGSAQLLPDDRPDQHCGGAARAIPGAGRGDRL